MEVTLPESSGPVTDAAGWDWRRVSEWRGAPGVASGFTDDEEDHEGYDAEQDGDTGGGDEEGSEHGGG